MNKQLRNELLLMVGEDQRMLKKLFMSGELPSEEYHPKMREIHEKNVAELKAIISRQGWPGIPHVGKKGAESAWLIAQHAVFDQNFMKECAELLKQAVAADEVEGWQLAFLQDRILTMSGKKQLYGTQFDVNKEGWPISFPIVEPETVNKRREALGLNSLEERLEQMCERERLRRSRHCLSSSYNQETS